VTQGEGPEFKLQDCKKKKRTGGVAQGLGLEFKPQYWEKKKRG
jgi:hypothetical protein